MSKPQMSRSIVESLTEKEKEAFLRTAWQQPGECIRATPLPVWPAFDRDALYGVAGDMVKQIEPHTESDTAALLLQAMTAFGNIVGRNSYYAVEGDRHYPNLYMCAVGVTGHARKGTSWGQVRRALAPVDEGWSRACIARGLSSGEGLIYRVRNETRKKHPIEKRGKVVDYEERIDDHGVEDKRLLVVETEFAQTLLAMGRKDNTLSAIMRNAWDCGELDTLTKNPLRATGAHISIIGHITGQELTKLLSNTEAANGLANRFLWACVRRSKLLPFGGQISSVDFTDVRRRLSQAVDFARRDQAIAMDLEAREAWDSGKLYDKLTDVRPGLLGAVTSRAESQTCRLALIYALLDSSRVIRWEHLNAADRLWDYCEASARFIFGDRLGDPMADKILAAIQRKDPIGLTRTEINDLFGGHTKTGEIEAALRVLLLGGFAHPSIQGTGGRDVEYWVLGAEKAEKAPLG